MTKPITLKDLDRLLQEREVRIINEYVEKINSNILGNYPTLMQGGIVKVPDGCKNTLHYIDKINDLFTDFEVWFPEPYIYIKLRLKTQHDKTTLDNPHLHDAESGAVPQ